MSFVDVRERVRDSPARARVLLTVRAAISSARSSERPCSFWLSLMCSYWRGRFVPYLTPLGGTAVLSTIAADLPARRDDHTAGRNCRAREVDASNSPG